MKVHVHILIACAVAASAMLHGCGGGGGGDSAPAGGTPAAAAPASSTTVASGAAPASAPPPDNAVAQSTTPNVQPIHVTKLHTGTRNMLQTSVTICVPGTSNCQTIDDIQVDTGSQGLRIVASAISPGLALPPVTASNGSVAASCTVFGSGYTWGAVRSADIRLAGHVAGATPIQVIADPAVPAAATDCAKSGLPMLTAARLRGNGILGVGPFSADCGAACASSPLPRWYYACNAGTCVSSTLAVAQQVANPVSRFPADNNGVLIELPPVPDLGASEVHGTLTFGIGSQANNLLGDATVLPGNAYSGYVTTEFDGRTFATSFIDSGSNGLFFPSNTLTVCGVWYCPPTAQNLAARIRSGSGATRDVSFAVSTSPALFASGNNAFANLAGPVGNFFDWGLPFFYGRRVFTALENRVTPAGKGPYYAF